MILLENQTNDTDGSQDTFTIEPSQVSQVGNYERIVWAEGTFDSATVSLEVRPIGASNYGAEVEFTSARREIIAIPTKLEIRGAVSGVGASTNVTIGVS